MVSLFIGLFGSIAMIAFAMISGGDIGAFIDLPAFLVVAGLAFFYSLASGGDFLERIESGEISSSILLFSIKISVALLNSAAISG